MEEEMANRSAAGSRLIDPGNGEKHPDIVPVHRLAVRSWRTGRRLMPRLAPRNRQSVESSHDMFLYG
jgi:hypothetical protein